MPNEIKNIFKTCSTCNQSFPTLRQLIIHEKSHVLVHEAPNPDFQCKTCSEIFSSKVALETHERNHYDQFLIKLQTEKMKPKSTRTPLSKRKIPLVDNSSILASIDETLEEEFRTTDWKKSMRVKKNRSSASTSASTATSIGHKYQYDHCVLETVKSIRRDIADPAWKKIDRNGIEVTADQHDHQYGQHDHDHDHIEPKIQCKYCLGWVPNDLYKQHLKKAHHHWKTGVLQYFCYLCESGNSFWRRGTYYSRMEDFHQHIQKVHGELAPVDCEGESSDNELDMSRQKDIVEDDDSGSATPESSAPTGHTTVSMKIDPPASDPKDPPNAPNSNYECDYCLSTYVNILAFKEHHRRYHSNACSIYKYFCYKCRRGRLARRPWVLYSSKEALLSHYQKVHGNSKKDEDSGDEDVLTMENPQKFDYSVICKYCMRKLSSVQTLRLHRKTLHQDDFLYFCSICKRGKEKLYFPNKKALMKHFKSEHKETLVKLGLLESKKKGKKSVARGESGNVESTEAEPAWIKVKTEIDDEDQSYSAGEYSTAGGIGLVKVKQEIMDD